MFDELTIQELRKKIQAKEVSTQELADFYLERIKQHNEILNAFISQTPERAVSDAERVATIDAPLGGIPASIKDVIITKDIRSTGGSQILKEYVPPYNATLVNKLDDAGLILLGKTNCDEFAMGGSNENSSFGPVKNPWNLDHVSGGSSGGSAAAVAAGMSHYSIGTDTGGSVREPASFCNVVGFKPTYGAISRYGLMAMGSSLDQAGIFARHIEDVREVFSVIAGSDTLDATSVHSDSHLDTPKHVAMGSLKGIKVGVPKEYFGEGLDGEVKDTIDQAIAELKKAGAEIIEISLPHSNYALAAYYIIMPAEVSSNMGRYDGIRYGASQVAQAEPAIEQLEALYKANRSEFLGDEVKRRIMLGTYVLSAGYYDEYYGKAQKVRQLIRQDFEQAFSQVDVVVGPVAPTPAFKLGEKTADPLEMYLADIYTVTANLAGLPALSVPAGFAPSSGLPIGLHMIGNTWDDYRLLAIAEVFQQATDHQMRKPELIS